MTHPLFRKDIFVETAFERRFQAMLRAAWHQRSWHVIVADPGSGKTMGIRDMIRRAGSPAILAVVAPKNNEKELALGNQLFSALGLPLRGRWSDRKPRLMGYLHQYGTQCLIVDDAHDLSLEHLMFIKELTDQGRLQYDHPLGLCLVAAGRGNTIPLKETLDQPDPTWLQFRRRLDKLEPFCRIAGHTSEEVREILATLETVYHELFPQLNLRQWAGSIYTWLTQPVLDPTNSGRVTMDYLMKLVTTALEWTYQAGETDVRAETLEKAASLLVLRRDTLRIIDGAGPSVEASPAASTGQAQASGTEAEQGSSPPAQPEKPPAAPTVQIEQARSRKKAVLPPTTSTKCTFSGVVHIFLKCFLESGVALVECPECAATRTLEPHEGGLRFKPHDKRKTTTPNTRQRWARGETDWGVVGG
jgi:AAA domain-containing protein